MVRRSEGEMMGIKTKKPLRPNQRYGMEDGALEEGR